MRLRDLDAQFVSHWTPTGRMRQGDTVEGAQGIMFQCPKCAVGCEAGEEVLPHEMDGGTGYWNGDVHVVLCKHCGKGFDASRFGDEACFARSRRFVRGAHYVLCWFTNPRNAERVPDDADPKPGRWTFAGESIDDITFVGPAAASVLLTGEGCQWHGFVKDGDAT